MNHNCLWIHGIIGAIIIVFTLWSTAFSKWIVIIAAIGIIIHALLCKNCKMPKQEMQMKTASKKRK